MKKIFAITLMMIFLMSACASGGAANQSISYEESVSADSAAYGRNAGAPAPSLTKESEMPLEPAYDQGVAGDGGDSIERMVIKNAYLSIAVAEPAVSMQKIMTMAESMGGFVVSSNLYQTYLESGVEVPQANVTVRVPAERLSEAMEIIKSGAGEVLNENVSGQDVTMEYTDIQSRLRNLYQTEEQLSLIMEEAKRTEDVLSVHRELTNIRGQIEVLEGQAKYYEQSAALSMISVEIMADAAVQPLMIGKWEPVGVAKDAIEALLNTLQGLGDFLIWAVIYLLPLVIVIGIPVWLVIRGVRRRRNKKNSGEINKTE